MRNLAIFTVIALSVGTHYVALAQNSSDKKAAVADIPRVAADGGPRRWQFIANSESTIYSEPSFGAPSKTTVDDDGIAVNLGCDRINDKVWCHVEITPEKVRGYIPADLLTPVLTVDGTVLTGVNDSQLRARKRDFDAQQQTPCAQERGEPMGLCTAQVARSGGGDATVVVHFSNGFNRTLYFVNGEFISANATMSGSGSDTNWQFNGQFHRIRVDDQQYELSDQLIHGQ